jgi:AcrR family transcriptional regulator
MPSTSANQRASVKTARRKPQQTRAAARRASILDAAARLIAESGLDAVTMTAIAEESKASIGALYDYFPDKQALVQALALQYAEEMDAYWRELLESKGVLTKTMLAEVIVDGALAFARSRPAYLALFGGRLVIARSAAARRPLRRAFADALRRFDGEMTEERAFLRAQIIVELIKSLLAVCKETDAKNRETVTLEFKRVMGFYLSEMEE